jgi:hypothetical protein
VFCQVSNGSHLAGAVVILVRVNSTRGDSLTRRFDIGPFVLALAALVLLVSLFLPWVDYRSVIPAGEELLGRSEFNAWRLFEITDLALAALAIASIAAAIGFLTPSVELVDRRWVPWIVGITFVLTANQILAPAAVVRTGDLGTGAWMAFGASVFMGIGALLSLGKVHFAVAVEGRDRRRRVSAVDHRPPPTESGEAVPRRSSLLDDPPEAAKES